MTFNNADRKNIRNAEKAARLAESNRIAYIRQIMSTAPGRAWMHDLLLSCSIFRTPFVFSAPDVTAFNCGAQNIGLRIFGDVASACPHEYTLMMTEASTKEAANDRRNSEPSIDPDGRPAEGFDGNPPKPTGSYSVDASGFVSDDSTFGWNDTGSEGPAN